MPRNAELQNARASHLAERMCPGLRISSLAAKCIVRSAIRAERGFFDRLKRVSNRRKYAAACPVGQAGAIV